MISIDDLMVCRNKKKETKKIEIEIEIVLHININYVQTELSFRVVLLHKHSKYFK